MNNIATNETVSIVERIFGKAAGRKVPCQPERFDIVRKGTAIGRIHY